MAHRKSTNKELVEELRALNTLGLYDKIIARAKENGYHDFKIDYEKYPDCICPKKDLIADLSKFAGLSGLRLRVMEGEFDEVMDAEDKENLRQNLINSGEENLLAVFKL